MKSSTRTFRPLPGRSRFAAAILLVVSSFVTGAWSSADDLVELGQRFQPPGMWIWDNWFVHDGDRWHAFFLQLPKAIGSKHRWKNNDLFKHVGHATTIPGSKNAFEWKNEGPALFALPGTWNDRHIATGSIILHEGRWWMYFTGRGNNGDAVGLAMSDDLSSWETLPTPVFPLIDTFAVSAKTSFDAVWKGNKHRWAGISDPYVYPEPVEGWFYMILCSRVLDTPIETSGCLSLVRSQDLSRWEPAGIIAWPGCFERMETPQLRRRKDGSWQILFGGVLNQEWAERKENQDGMPQAVRGKRSHQNYVYHLPDGFPQLTTDENLHYIAAPGGNYYIMKMLPQVGDNTSEDVAFFTVTEPARGTCLSEPWQVRYTKDGGISLEPYARERD